MTLVEDIFFQLLCQWSHNGDMPFNELLILVFQVGGCWLVHHYYNFI